MKRSLRPIGHEDRLSLVDHLDELRNRLIISGAVLVVAFGFCFWQNHELLRIINKPLTAQTQKQVLKGEGTVGQAVLAQRAIIKAAQDTSRALRLLAAPGSGLSAGTRGQLGPLAQTLQRDVARLPRNPSGDKPVTLSVGEPFTTTLTVALYFALIITLPVILYELFAFLLPALKPEEKRAFVPLLTAVPALFLVGVAFGYFVVLPAAVRFFVNFNADQFNNLVQANQFYKFAATILLAMGLVFQVPVVILGLTRLEIVSVAQLRHYRRYAIVACAAVAAFLPGDVITLLLETVPLYLLYEASILLAAILGRARSRAGNAAAAGDVGSHVGDPAPAADDAERPTVPDDAERPTVEQIIDHTDEDLS
jgi:sec-independent protein translocase protein TatC